MEEKLFPGNMVVSIWALLSPAPVSSSWLQQLGEKSVYIKESPFLMAFQYYCQRHLFLCTERMPECI